MTKLMDIPSILCISSSQFMYVLLVKCRHQTIILEALKKASTLHLESVEENCLSLNAIHSKPTSTCGLLNYIYQTHKMKVHVSISLMA